MQEWVGGSNQSRSFGDFVRHHVAIVVWNFIQVLNSISLIYKIYILAASGYGTEVYIEVRYCDIPCSVDFFSVFHWLSFVFYDFIKFWNSLCQICKDWLWYYALNLCIAFGRIIIYIKYIFHYIHFRSISVFYCFLQFLFSVCEGSPYRSLSLTWVGLSQVIIFVAIVNGIVFLIICL